MSVPDKNNQILHATKNNMIVKYIVVEYKSDC